MSRVAALVAGMLTGEGKKVAPAATDRPTKRERPSRMYSSSWNWKQRTRRFNHHMRAKSRK